LKSKKKVLFVTVYLSNKNTRYDYFQANSNSPFFRFSLPRIVSFGLRFLKQNIPEIEILEYPTWNQYQQKIKERDWDIVGFSFYLNEIHEILEMVEYARDHEIPEIWAGNYGGLTKEIQHNFDKVFTGYCEEQIGKYFGRNISKQEIIHPPLIGNTNYHGFKLNFIGYLFTNRGCSSEIRALPL